MRYSESTRRYFEAAVNDGWMVGAAAADTASDFRGSAGDREQGTWVQFQVKVTAGRILAARFLAFGCPHTVAVAAWIAEHASGEIAALVLPEPIAALARRFEVPAEKLGRLLVVEDAWLSLKEL